MKKKIFESIYHTAAWGVGSGKGSEPEYASSFIQHINELLHQGTTIDDTYDVVVDLGCGDWQFGGSLELLLKQYIGVDIVPKLVAHLQADFAAPPFVNFQSFDFSNPKLLKDFIEDVRGKRTLILVKDVLQHWNDKDIRKFLDALDELNWDRCSATLLTANNWRHFRSPQKPVNPRDVDGNRYHWAPVNLLEKPWTKYKFQEVMYYPRGKYKMVVRKDY